MSEQAPITLHIGPLREESQRLLQQHTTPALVVYPPHSKVPTGMPANVRSTTAWVTPNGSERSCYRYSLADFNSLAEATGLTQLYPGVSLQECQPVETQALADIIDEQGAKNTPITALVIEQADQAKALLETLQEQGALATVNHLWVRTSPVRLYTEMPVQQTLIEWCEEQGFEPVEEEAEDPEFCLQAFKRNRLHSALNEAQQQNSAFKKKIEALTAERDELSNTLAATQKEASGAQEEREALRKQVQELKQHNQQLSNESSETQKKQHQLEIELERAEAQLELIKELLLKDKLLSNQAGS